MHAYQDDDLVDLTITPVTSTSHDGKTESTKAELIHTNKKRPFLTIEKGFLPVGQIKIGMHVVRADGSVGIVSGWVLIPGVKTMYNLEVAQDHTFTVGDEQWVVHNTSCLNPDAEIHIFEGELNASGNAKGYHWEGRSGTPGEVVPGTETTPDARGVYKAKVRVSGVLKTGKSSFFPKSWSEAEVKAAIDEAYAGRMFVAGNTYIGDTSSGVIVQMFVDPGTDEIISAFPWYEPGVP